MAIQIWKFTNEYKGQLYPQCNGRLKSLGNNLPILILLFSEKKTKFGNFPNAFFPWDF